MRAGSLLDSLQSLTLPVPAVKAPRPRAVVRKPARHIVPDREIAGAFFRINDVYPLPHTTTNNEKQQNHNDGEEKIEDITS